MASKIIKKEARLAAQRLCKRRQYAEIKMDPELSAIAKDKRKQKYLKAKESKKIKSISQKSKRDQKEQREKWRENSKRYRQKKKDTKKPIFECLQIQAVSESAGDSDPACLIDSSVEPLVSELIIKSLQRL